MLCKRRFGGWPGWENFWFCPFFVSSAVSDDFVFSCLWLEGCPESFIPSQPFWLWYSVVFVLISMTTDGSPTGDLFVTPIFSGRCPLELAQGPSSVALALHETGGSFEKIIYSVRWGRSLAMWGPHCHPFVRPGAGKPHNVRPRIVSPSIVRLGTSTARPGTSITLPLRGFSFRGLCILGRRMQMRF